MWGAGGETIGIFEKFCTELCRRCGITVAREGRSHNSASDETILAVDRAQSVLFVDRTRSGAISFDPKLPERQEAPLTVAAGRMIAPHIFVDRRSAEVLANNGEAVISDLVFPSSSSRGIELYSKGGKARTVNLDVWNLKSVWSKAARLVSPAGPRLESYSPAGLKRRFPSARAGGPQRLQP